LVFFCILTLTVDYKKNGYTVRLPIDRSMKNQHLSAAKLVAYIEASVVKARDIWDLLYTGDKNVHTLPRHE
jgi:hypothetical protein